MRAEYPLRRWTTEETPIDDVSYPDFGNTSSAFLCSGMAVPTGRKGPVAALHLPDESGILYLRLK